MASEEKKKKIINAGPGRKRGSLDQDNSDPLWGSTSDTCIQFSTWNIQSLLNLTETYSVDAQPSHWLAKGLW